MNNARISPGTSPELKFSIHRAPVAGGLKKL
jgi:hypothetical protein